MFSQYNIDSSLVAHFPFSGNTNNKIVGLNGSNYSANLTADRFNNLNSAYSFNGTSSYIDLQEAYDLPNRSVSFWFNASLIQTTAKFIYVSDFGTIKNGCTAVNVIKSSGIDKITFAVGYQRAEAPISTNDWHHVVIIKGVSVYLVYRALDDICETQPIVARILTL